MRANYLVQVITNRPTKCSNHSSFNRSRSKGSRFVSTKSKSRVLDLDNTNVITGSARRRGRRPGQKNERSGKDPDYDPAADEGWRIGIPCSASALRRQMKRNGRPGQPNSLDGGENVVSDDGDDDEGGVDDSELDERLGKQTKIEEVWMSEDELNLWEIRVFMD